MSANVPVALIDDLLDLRRGWVTSRLDAGRIAITRYVGDGSPLGHLSLSVEEAHKMCAVLSAWLETTASADVVEECRRGYLVQARRGIEIERMKEKKETGLNGDPSQGS